MKTLIFNTDNIFQMAVSSIPSNDYLDESNFKIALIPEGESYDKNYAYSPVDGVAVKGALIPVDTVENERLAAEVIATQYSRDRKKKYNQLNQDEMRYDDVKNSTTTWVDAINAIKTAHPKP
jgi:hypothetical protein